MAGLDPDLSSYNGYGSTNKLLATATNSPENALQWQGYAANQQALQSNQLKLSQQHLGALNDLVSSVMADPSPQNATARVMDGIHMGVISAEDGNAELQNFAQMAAGQQDPTQPNEAIRRYAFQHGQPLIDAMQRTTLAGMGTPSLVNTGGALQPYQAQGGVNPGVAPVSGRMGLSQSPGELAAPVTWTDSQGVKHQGTQRQYQGVVGDPSGIDNPNSYVDPQRAATAGASFVDGKLVYGTGAATPGAPIQPGDKIQNGPVGSSHGRTGGPAVAGAGMAGATGGSGTSNATMPGLAGPSPMLAGGIEDYRSDLNNSTAKMQGIQPLLSALPLIQQLGATGSGPGTKAFNDAKSALVSAGVIPANATDVQVREEANKYLNQYVARSGIAQRSDMGTLVSQQSSPNLETSNAATVALTRNAIAQDRMEAARPLAYQNNDLSGYTPSRAAWTQNQDPRAYQLDVMPADQRATLLQKMATQYRGPAGAAKDEATRFFNSLKNASLVGVRPPSGPAAGGVTNGQ